MKKLLALLLILMLMPTGVVAEGDSETADWPNGRIWGDLQFYPSYEAIRLEGYAKTEESFLGEEGTLAYNGYVYGISISISSTKTLPSKTLTLRGRDATTADGIAQFASVFTEVVEKWGTPTNESWQKTWQTKTSNDLDDLAQSAEAFTYGVRWTSDRYGANVSVSRDKRGVCSIFIVFTDSGK